MDNAKNFFKKNYCFLSFFVGSVCMYMILSYAGVLRTGKYCILEGDLFEIYVPVIRNFCRNLLSGRSIYYSWNNSFGMNTSVMLSFYGAFNPFNILYLIFYKADPNVITALVVILKAGLAALTFQLFEKIVLKVDGLKSVVFSILYALCSFHVAYGIVNIIWTDALYVLPVVFISLYILQNKGNPIPLTLSYAYIFIVQPYMGFVVGVFSFIYFIISLFLTERKVSLLKYILGFVISAVTAVLISSVTWLPALYQLMKSGISNSEGFASLGINPLDVYNQMFFGNNNSIVECMPNIYCGILSFILLPIFFIDKKNEVKTKIKAGILLLVLVLSCVILPFYKFWCAFDAPDGWPFRFSFCFSFVIVAIAAIESKHIKEIDFRILFAVAGADIAVYILEIFLLKRSNIFYPINNYLYLLINLGIILVWIGAIYLLKKYAEDEKKIKGIGLCFLLLACFEIIGNGFCSYYKGDNYYTTPETNETQFYSWYENQKQLTDYLKSDNSFYRVNFMADYLYNSDTFTGYNGLSDFSTSENLKLREALNKMGFATSRKVMRNFGITPVTKMLLGVKYDADCYLPYAGSDTIPPLEISRNPYALSLGYMVDEGISDYSFETSNAFENLNSIVSVMTGKDISIFEDIDKSNIVLVEEGLELKQSDNGYVFINSANEYDSYINFLADSEIEDEDLYIYFDNYSSELTGYSMITMDGFENRHELGGALSRSYIKPFENYKVVGGTETKVIVMSNGVVEQGIKDYYIASFNDDALYNAYDELSDEQLIIDKFTNTHISGKIETKNDNEILFTSIPYEDAWSVKVDGNDAEIIPLLNDAFIGIRLPKGNHSIEFSYKVAGLKGGILLTVLGILMFAIIILIEKFAGIKSIKEE